MWLLAGWLAASLALIGPALLWHVEYFRNPGPQFYRMILAAAPASFLAALAYGWFRPKALRRAEPWLLTGLAVAGPLLWKPVATAATLLLLCASIAAGRRVLELMKLELAASLERLALSAGIGFGLLIPLLMLPAPKLGFWAWAAASLALGFGALRRAAAETLDLLRRWSASPTLDHPLAGVATAFAFPFLGIVLALALAPAIAHDALMMHLAAVRRYLAAGGLDALPHLSSTYFPQGAELLMAAVASVAGMPAAQLIQPLFFALSLAALACVAARAGVRPAARVAGVLLAAALPFLVWTGGVAKNDMPMALFQTLALLCALAAGGRQPKAWLRLGVFFLAASFSVKHTAAFGAAPLGLLYLWRWRKLERKGRELLVWAAIFAAIAGVWMLRAYLLRGNPFYPAKLSWAVESLRPNSMRPAEWRSIPYWRIPWTIHFDGTVAFESPSPNPSGFFLWLFAPLWLLVRRKAANAAETLCLVFVWIYFFYWGSVWPVVRYAIVPLALLVVLTAERLASAWEAFPRAWRPALASLVALNGVASLLAAMIFSLNAPQLALFASRIDEQEYLRRTLATYPVLEKLAEAYSPGDWTLSAGVTSAAYAPDPSRFWCEYLADPVAARNWVPALLRERRFAFLIVRNNANGDALVSNLPEGVSAKALFSDERYALHRLTYSEPSAPQ